MIYSFLWTLISFSDPMYLFSGRKKSTLRKHAGVQISGALCTKARAQVKY